MISRAIISSSTSGLKFNPPTHRSPLNDRPGKSTKDTARINRPLTFRGKEKPRETSNIQRKVPTPNSICWTKKKPPTSLRGPIECKCLETARTCRRGRRACLAAAGPAAAIKFPIGRNYQARHYGALLRVFVPPSRARRGRITIIESEYRTIR